LQSDISLHRAFSLLCLQYREIELDVLVMEAQEADGTGTQASEDRLKDKETEHKTTNGEVISHGMLLLSTRRIIFGLKHLTVVINVINLHSY
jgi:hypothetical protein